MALKAHQAEDFLMSALLTAHVQNNNVHTGAKEEFLQRTHDECAYTSEQLQAFGCRRRSRHAR